MRRFNPDIVHAHEPLSPGPPLWATVFATVPVVGTFHAYCSEWPHSWLCTVEAALLSSVWRRLNMCVAVSEAAARLIHARTGRRVHVLPNGADVDLFCQRSSGNGSPGRRLLFVGRLEPRKGLAVTVAAFARLAAIFPNLTLVVVGDGSERRVVDTLPPDVRARVVLLGNMPHAETPAAYAGADVFVASLSAGRASGLCSSRQWQRVSPSWRVTSPDTARSCATASKVSWFRPETRRRWPTRSAVSSRTRQPRIRAARPGAGTGVLLDQAVPRLEAAYGEVLQRGPRAFKVLEAESA